MRGEAAHEWGTQRLRGVGLSDHGEGDRGC